MEEKKSRPLSERSDEDKPREKMLARGSKSLSKAELIAILLRSGVQGKNAIELAQEILDRVGDSLTALSQMEISHLSRIKGMGTAKATSLMAALELGWRMGGEMVNKRETVIRTSADLHTFLQEHLVNLDYEEFWAVYLNNRNKVLGLHRISMGGQTATPADLRIIFRHALDCKAVAFMVAHNHPSGNLTPSREDRELTRRLADAGKLMEIKLREHLILGIDENGKSSYYSFHDNGLL